MVLAGLAACFKAVEAIFRSRCHEDIAIFCVLLACPFRLLAMARLQGIKSMTSDPVRSVDTFKHVLMFRNQPLLRLSGHRSAVSCCRSQMGKQGMQNCERRGQASRAVDTTSMCVCAARVMYTSGRAPCFFQCPPFTLRAKHEKQPVLGSGSPAGLTISYNKCV